MKQLPQTDDLLVIAYRYVHKYDVQNQSMCERYGLRPNTLTDISSGKTIARSREKYLQAFVRELVRIRSFAEVKKDTETEVRITQQLADLMVIQYCPNGKNNFPYR